MVQPSMNIAATTPGTLLGCQSWRGAILMKISAAHTSIISLMVVLVFVMIASLITAAHPAHAEPECGVITEPRIDLEPEEGMGPLDLNGYQLVDAQYLNFIGDAPVRYPEGVLWGFYNPDATDAAKACAGAAYRQVKAVLGANLPTWREAARLGVTTKIYLWINDYTRATCKIERRPAVLAHWPHEKDYAYGSWKWIATLTQEGRCFVPDPQQIEAEMRQAIHAIEMMRFYSSF